MIARNTSPDIPFDRSINPYRGCEHGCVYCYARPTHAYLGLSPGLDFETKLRAKFDAATLLERELARPGYACQPIALGTNTDPYQPVERRLGITRRVLEVLARCRHPVDDRHQVGRRGARPRSAGADGAPEPGAGRALGDHARWRARAPARAARRRAASAPARRSAQLSAAGVPTAVMVAPIIPALTDQEIERILEAAAAAGASSAGYVLLRLPHEVKELFEDWLERARSRRAPSTCFRSCGSAGAAGCTMPPSAGVCVARVLMRS